MLHSVFGSNCHLPLGHRHLGEEALSAVAAVSRWVCISSKLLSEHCPSSSLGRGCFIGYSLRSSISSLICILILIVISSRSSSSQSITPESSCCCEIHHPGAGQPRLAAFSACPSQARSTAPLNLVWNILRESFSNLRYLRRYLRVELSTMRMRISTTRMTTDHQNTDWRRIDFQNINPLQCNLCVTFD
jgi:hypothetical protein